MKKLNVYFTVALNDDAKVVENSFSASTCLISSVKGTALIKRTAFKSSQSFYSLNPLETAKLS